MMTPATTTSRDLKILLVDDDERFVYAMRILLAAIPQMTICLDCAQTYDQGLAIINRREHQLYLIAHRVNGCNGLDVLAQIVGKRGRTPVIFLTGLKDRDAGLQAMDAGAADYLIKDRIDAAQLERCIRYSLDRQRLQRQVKNATRRLRAAVRRPGSIGQTSPPTCDELLRQTLGPILLSLKAEIRRMTADDLTVRRDRALSLLDRMASVTEMLNVEHNSDSPANLA